MNQTDINKLLEDEIKKLVTQQIKVTSNNNDWILNVNNTEIKIPKISNTLVRKNILTSK